MKKIDGIKIVIISLISIICLILIIFNYKNNEINKEIENEQLKEEKISNIKSHYSKYVKTISETDLYVLENDEYKSVGKLGNVELILDDIEIDENSEYFKINNFDSDYYVLFNTVTPIDGLSTKGEKEERYKNYIPFNENVITKDVTKLYKDDSLVYELPESLSLPIIIKDDDKIYVEYQDDLFYVLKSEIDSTTYNHNTDKTNIDGIPTLVYHFVYTEGVDPCDQIICNSTTQIQSHIDYLKSENYFTPTMKEFEMYIDGKLQLPKSVMITVDDGWYSGNARDIFTNNKMNATIFVITSIYDPKPLVTDYVEVHSHGDDLHKQGVCPGGQGGGIKCLDKSVLLADLKTSSEKTLNSTVFCYPFYEYNDYAISVLKEAGYTMAFAGEYAGGHYKMTVGADKYRIPRFTLLSDSSVNYLKTILNK